jgi:hypothetical protein
MRMDARVTLLACAAAFVVNMIGMTIAGAEISGPRNWILWGILLAALRAQTLTPDTAPVEVSLTSRSGVFYPARSSTGS